MLSAGEIYFNTKKDELYFTSAQLFIFIATAAITSEQKGSNRGHFCLVLERLIYRLFSLLTLARFVLLLPNWEMGLLALFKGGPYMRIPQYDIFSGTPSSSGAIWKEAVVGLGAANDRMMELAAMVPGPYFVFDASTGKVVAHTDNSSGYEDERQREAC